MGGAFSLIIAIVFFGLQAQAAWLLRAGYLSGSGSANTGNIGTWSQYPAMTDKTALSTSPNGFGASIAHEESSWGSRLTYDLVSTAENSGQILSITNNNSPIATVSSLYTSHQLGADVYLKTKRDQGTWWGYYGGLGLMMAQVHLQEKFVFDTANYSTLMNGTLEATGDATIGYRAFAGANLFLGKGSGLSFELIYAAIKVAGFSADQDYQYKAGLGSTFAAGQPVRKINQNGSGFLDDGINADLSYLAAKVSVFYFF